MARISELIDDLEHTPPRLLRTMEMLMDGGRKIELLLGPEHRLGVRAVLETQGLYPYAKRPYFFMAGEPCWRSPYTELNIVYDEQLKAWLLMDVQSCILSLCERYNLPSPVCARPDEPSESVLARLREWCLMLKIREQPQTAGDRHSDDYSSVTWKGKAYTFAPTQARAVRVLWEAHQNGTPDVHQATIHEHIESASESQRLRDLFKGHAAWQNMIVPGEGKGMFRLS